MLGSGPGSCFPVRRWPDPRGEMRPLYSQPLLIEACSEARTVSHSSEVPAKPPRQSLLSYAGPGWPCRTIDAPDRQLEYPSGSHQSQNVYYAPRIIWLENAGKVILCCSGLKERADEGLFALRADNPQGCCSAMHCDGLAGQSPCVLHREYNLPHGDQYEFVRWHVGVRCEVDI